MIRPATVDDIAAIVELGAAMHAESPVYGGHEFAPEKLIALAEGLIRGGGIVLVAERDGVLVGFMAGLVTPHFFSVALTAVEMAVYVYPDHRGGTVAPRLIRAFEACARDQGAAEVQVGVSAGINDDRAVGLYERLGYRRHSIGLRKDVSCVSSN